MMKFAIAPSEVEKYESGDKETVASVEHAARQIARLQGKENEPIVLIKIVEVRVKTLKPIPPAPSEPESA